MARKSACPTCRVALKIEGSRVSYIEPASGGSPACKVSVPVLAGEFQCPKCGAYCTT